MQHFCWWMHTVHRQMNVVADDFIYLTINGNKSCLWASNLLSALHFKQAHILQLRDVINLGENVLLETLHSFYQTIYAHAAAIVVVNVVASGLLYPIFSGIEKWFVKIATKQKQKLHLPIIANYFTTAFIENTWTNWFISFI